MVGIFYFLSFSVKVCPLHGCSAELLGCLGGLAKNDNGCELCQCALGKHCRLKIYLTSSKTNRFIFSMSLIALKTAIKTGYNRDVLTFLIEC